MVVINNLSDAIAQQLRDYALGIGNITSQIAYESGKEGAKLLRKSYSTRRTGNYNSGWKVSRAGGQVRIYNAKAPYLTHLLENGHDIKKNGVIVGYADPIPHISLVEQNVIGKFERNLERAIQAVRSR